MLQYHVLGSTCQAMACRDRGVAALCVVQGVSRNANRIITCVWCCRAQQRIMSTAKWLLLAVVFSPHTFLVIWGLLHFDDSIGSLSWVYLSLLVASLTLRWWQGQGWRPTNWGVRRVSRVQVLFGLAVFLLLFYAFLVVWRCAPCERVWLPVRTHTHAHTHA